MLVTRLLESVVSRIERAESIDPVSEKIAKVSEKIPQPAAVTNVLGGTVLGHPLHPLLVTMPIGSWSCALIFDLLGEKEGARKLTGLGIIFAVPTMLAGHHDWQYTDDAERRVGTVHAALNNIALSAFVGSWLARRAGRHGVGVALALVGGTAVSAGGWLGGHLSYAMGVGVDTTAFQHSTQEWTRVASEADVRAGELAAVDLAGVPVLLTRDQRGALVAMADRCTHRGAPLHEGKVEDGCVICPWHDSAFAFDGAVERGPASRPQQHYEVEVRAGEVYLRSPAEPRSLRTNPVGV